MTTQGQPITYRTSSTGYHHGFIAGNITNGGATADILVFENGNQWEDTGNAISSTTLHHEGVNQGSSIGEWQLNAGLIPPTPNWLEDSYTAVSGARSLNTPFQPSASRPTWVTYSVRVAGSITLTTGALGRVELMSDASNPPTTSRGRVAGGITGTVVVGITVSDIKEGQLTYLVPAGHYVSLVTTNEVGTPTYTLTSQYELEL